MVHSPIFQEKKKSLQKAFLQFPLFGSNSEGLLQSLLSGMPHRLQNASLADLLKWSLTAAKIRISQMTTLLAATHRVPWCAAPQMLILTEVLLSVLQSEESAHQPGGLPSAPTFSCLPLPWSFFQLGTSCQSASLIAEFYDIDLMLLTKQDLSIDLFWKLSQILNHYLNVNPWMSSKELAFSQRLTIAMLLNKNLNKYIRVIWYCAASYLLPHWKDLNNQNLASLSTWYCILRMLQISCDTVITHCINTLTEQEPYFSTYSFWKQLVSFC